MVGIAFVAVAAGLWIFMTYGPGQSSRTTTVATSQSTSPSTVATPTAASSGASASHPRDKRARDHNATRRGRSFAGGEPGTVVIAAQGLADPSNPRYQGNTSLLQADLRADAKSQLVEKALGLLVERASLAKNYDLLSERLLAKSPGFIGAVMRESEPRIGKDGLMSMTTEAVVNVKAVQKSLNQMSRDDRIELIRASGNPRIAMRITVHDADRPDAPPRSSPIAENLLKDRVKTFGFRTWAEGGERGQGG